MQRESQLCIPQTDMTREEYAAIYRESFSMGAKYDSQRFSFGELSNGARNGLRCTSGEGKYQSEPAEKYSEKEWPKPPCGFQNKPGTGRIQTMRDYYQMVFGPVPTPAPMILALLFALLAYSRGHFYFFGVLLLLAVVAGIVYVKESG